MSGLLLDSYDPETTARTKLTIDAETGCTLIIRQQNYRPIVDDAKRQAGMFDRHASRKAGARQIATIPVVEYFKLLRQGVARDPKAFRRWLSRRDTRHFRTDDGRRLI